MFGTKVDNLCFSLRSSWFLFTTFLAIAYHAWSKLEQKKKETDVIWGISGYVYYFLKLVNVSWRLLVFLLWIYLAQHVTLCVLFITLIMNHARLRYAGWYYKTSVKNNELKYEFSEYIKKPLHITMSTFEMPL